jgi:hypothetical protein
MHSSDDVILPGLKLANVHGCGILHLLVVSAVIHVGIMLIEYTFVSTHYLQLPIVHEMQG